MDKEFPEKGPYQSTWRSMDQWQKRGRERKAEGKGSREGLGDSTIDETKEHHQGGPARPEEGGGEGENGIFYSHGKEREVLTGTLNLRM